MEAFIITAVSLMLYLLPTLICGARGHHQQYAIAALNITLGWSGLGWLAAFIWSLTATKKMSWSAMDTWIAIAAMVLIVCGVFMALMWGEDEQDSIDDTDGCPSWSCREYDRTADTEAVEAIEK